MDKIGPIGGGWLGNVTTTFIFLRALGGIAVYAHEGGFTNLFPIQRTWEGLLWYSAAIVQFVAVFGALTYFVNRFWAFRALVAWALIEIWNVLDSIAYSVHNRLGEPLIAWQLKSFLKALSESVDWSFAEIWFPLFCFVLIRKIQRGKVVRDPNIGFEVVPVTE